MKEDTNGGTRESLAAFLQEMDFHGRFAKGRVSFENLDQTVEIYSGLGRSFPLVMVKNERDNPFLPVLENRGGEYFERFFLRSAFLRQGTLIIDAYCIEGGRRSSIPEYSYEIEVRIRQLKHLSRCG